MPYKDGNTKTDENVEEYEPTSNSVSENLLKDLEREQSLLTDDFPLCTLLIDEAFDRFYSAGQSPGSEIYADVFNQKTMKLTQKMFVPVKLRDKILKANKDFLTRFQDATHCKIIIRGRNSMDNHVKEEELRQSGDKRFRHLSKDLFLEIRTEAAPIDCYTSIANALAKIRKYLISDENDENEDTNEVIKIEPEAVVSAEIVKCEELESNPIKIDSPSEATFKEPKSSSLLLKKPQEKRDKTFIISLADKLIKLLDETVLNPNFHYSEEDTMMVSNNIDILNSFIVSKVHTKSMEISSNSSRENKLTNASLSEIRSQSKNKNLGTTKRCTIKRKITKNSTDFNNIESKNERGRTIKKKLLRSALQKKESFPGIFYIKDKKSNKIIKRQISNRTALSRCLKRSDKDSIDLEEEVEYKPFTLEYLQRTPTELVFEYTPRNIIFSLLDTMKNYPVLWEFHDKPFNEDYIESIEDLCQIINVKWSMNIDSWQMRRTVSRILRFYRFLFPFETIEKFTDYFDKCAIFLPLNVMEIPHARCTHCFICYKEDIELRKHLAEEHKSLEWPHKCKHCGEIFKNSHEYEFHKRLPHYVEIFTCEQCNERFNHRFEYNQHLAKHQPNQTEEIRNHECDECGKKFKTLRELRSHKYYHEEKKFKCHLCPKSFFKSPNLTLHLKRHRNELDVICEVCGKGFVHHRYLNDHMDTHNGVQITCNICNLKLRRGNLLRHLRTVHVAVEGTIESTFRAKGHRYNKHNYSRRRVMNPKYERSKRSKRTNEKLPRQYDCKNCNIHFDRLKFLKDHNKQHHADVNRLPCKMCDSELSQKHNLKRHYREKHKLHDYQIFAIVEKNENINIVLAMSPEELEKMNIE